MPRYCRNHSLLEENTILLHAYNATGFVSTPFLQLNGHFYVYIEKSNYMTKFKVVASMDIFDLLTWTFRFAKM
mgnify:CR=1 FL=1